jgi:hypothetical protein
MRLKDTVALITSSASGIGKEIAIIYRPPMPSTWHHRPAPGHK